MKIILKLLLPFVLFELAGQDFKHQATIGYYTERLQASTSEEEQFFSPEGIYDNFNEMLMLSYYHRFSKRFSGKLDMGLDIGLLPNFINFSGGFHLNDFLKIRGNVRKMIIPHDYSYFENQVKLIHGEGFYGYDVDNVGKYMHAYRSVYQLGAGAEGRISKRWIEVYGGADLYGGASPKETYTEHLEALNSNLLILHETTMIHPCHFSLQGNAGLGLTLIKNRWFTLEFNYELRGRGDWFKFQSVTDVYEWTRTNHQDFEEFSHAFLSSIQNQFGGRVSF